jgi:hypothetical protein
MASNVPDHARGGGRCNSVIAVTIERRLQSRSSATGWVITIEVVRRLNHASTETAGCTSCWTTRSPAPRSAPPAGYATGHGERDKVERLRRERRGIRCLERGRLVCRAGVHPNPTSAALLDHIQLQ